MTRQLCSTLKKVPSKMPFEAAPRSNLLMGMTMKASAGASGGTIPHQQGKTHHRLDASDMTHPRLPARRMLLHHGESVMTHRTTQRQTSPLHVHVRHLQRRRETVTVLRQDASATILPNPPEVEMVRVE